MITLDDLNDAYHAWHKADLLVQRLHNNPNVSTEEITQAINRETIAFQEYQAILFGFFEAYDSKPITR